jgi:hypothetical protein
VFIGPSRLNSGAYDLTQILPPSAPIVRGDELWFYYTGLKYRSTFFYEGIYPNGRTVDKPGLDPDRGAVCLAVLRKDGFVSLDPVENEGFVVTKPFRLAGSNVWLNVQCADGGEAAVEVLDQSNKVITASEPITGDGVRLPVKWKNAADLKPVQEQSVRLKIRLKRCALYAFEVGP